MSRRRVSKLAGLALAAVLTVGLLPAGAGADDDTDGGDPVATRPVSSRPGPGLSATATRALLDDLPGTTGIAALGGVSASATKSTLVHTDPTGDADPKSDITAVGARLTTSSLRLSITVPQMTDSATDPKWAPGRSSILWAIDAGANGTTDKVAIITATDGGLNSWVVGNTATPNALCSGNTTRQSGGRLSIQVPTACVGNPSLLSFGALFRYDYVGSIPSHQDQAPDGDTLAGPIARSASKGSASGVALASNGYLDTFDLSSPPPLSIWYSYSSLASPRGFVGTPDGGHGYVVTGSGRLFGIAFGSNNLPLPVYGTKTWPNQDVARGVAIRPNGSAGLVVDRFGNLYPFGIGGKRAVPTLLGVPKWPGVDMARGVAVMPDGSGGFTLDAFGGLNWFSIGTARPAPTLINPPSFGLNDSARGVAILPDGSGGYVIDRNSNVHFFSIGTERFPPHSSGKEPWPPDVTRGMGVLTATIPTPVTCTVNQPAC